MNARPPNQQWPRLCVLVALHAFTVTACGDSNDATPPLTGAIRTLSYVVTECEETAVGESPVGTQKLLIQRGAAAPLTIAQFPILGPPSPFAACGALGVDRFGAEFVAAGVFQRLEVSPDGSFVVFEVTDELAFCNDEVCLTPPPPPPGAAGLFYVRSDGTGLRRLGPASQVPLFYEPMEGGALILPSLGLSPNGQFGTLTDLGLGTDGGERTQIFTFDIGSGARLQVTQLPEAPPSPEFPETCCPEFGSNDVVGFGSFANPDDLNPNNELSFFTVKRDGTALTKIPSASVSPDSTVVPIFSIREGEPSVTIVIFPRQAPSGPPGQVQEILLVQDATQLLQLTNFDRSDTSNPVLSSDGTRVFFVGSSDPLGTNPTHNCQVFSIDTLGSNLQQLTTFSEVEESIAGCRFGPQGTGCAVFLEQQDSLTQTLVLYSSCDPFGSNPNGTQIFTMLPDGSGLRQLTTLRGLVFEPGAVTVQMPSQLAYQGRD